MIQLRALGVLDLRSSGDQTIRQVLAQPKRAALLTYLALARPRGSHPRETLLALFWPDHGAEQARNALSQAVHYLRRALGSEVIQSHNGDALSVAPSAIACDVDAFDDAVRDGHWVRALDLYQGELLEGFHVAHASEFERWLDAERQRLTGQIARVLETLALNNEQKNDYSAALTCWRRLAAREPYNSAIALRLMRALSLSGDPGAAARHARLHEKLLREELSVPVPADIAAFVLDLQTKPAPISAPPRPVDSPAIATAALTVDELCAKARQAMQTFTGESFADGSRFAQRAIDLDPAHAGAHLTLGWLFILWSQVDQQGNLRQRGIEHCQRALALAPGLPAVNAPLAWAAHLDARFEEAERLAIDGLAGDTSDFFSHFVLGFTRLVFGLARPRWDKCVESVQSFQSALALHPRDTHAQMALASLYTLAGQYVVAGDLLESAVETEQSPATELRSVGALTLFGRLHLHAGHAAQARTLLEEAAVDCADAPQLFAPFVNGLTGIALGDLARHAGRYDEAVQLYARARALLAGHPTLLGCGYLMVRADTRLAGAFRLLRMRKEEERHAALATALTGTRQGANFNWAWGASESELHYDWAVYHASQADSTAMRVALDRAAHFGWREVGLLAIEPAFAFHRDTDTTEFVARIKAQAALPEAAVSQLLRARRHQPAFPALI